MPGRLAVAFAAFLMCVRFADGQTVDLQQIAARLSRLEAQNAELAREVKALRAALAATQSQARTTTPVPDERLTTGEDDPSDATAEERLDVQERRIEELAQAKVESGSKLPLRVTGRLLVNVFSNGRNGGGNDYPTTASLEAGPRISGATVRQSTLGLMFDDVPAVLGANVSGSLFADFFAGTATPLNHGFRMRTAEVRLDWTNTSISAGQMKPILSPRDPTSLAQVGVDPLTSSGNLWFWQPQISVEQRFRLGEQTSVHAKVGLLQTNETAVLVPAPFAATVARARPALEGRVEFRRPNFELAPGFHASTTQVAGASVPSRAASVDWFFRPIKLVEFTGFAFVGQNVGVLGALRQGFVVLRDREAIAVRSRGGWAQVALIPTTRLSLHLVAGQHDDNNQDLRFGGVGKNQTYMANIMYRIAPNVIVALEGSQIRTTYLPGGVRRNNHYDLAIGYSF